MIIKLQEEDVVLLKDGMEGTVVDLMPDGRFWMEYKDEAGKWQLREACSNDVEKLIFRLELDDFGQD